MTDEYDPQTEMEAIHKRVGGWFEAFVRDPRYDRLKEVQKDNAPDVVRLFTEYSFRYVGAAPEQWSGGVLTECCLEVLPRKVSAGRSFFEAVAPVLSAFFDFLAEQSHLGKARELSTAVAELEEDIVAASQDERNWGPSKAFIMAAERAGVDTCNEAALRQYMAEYNLQQLARMEAREVASTPAPPSLPAPAEPVRHAQPRVGRNAPCPCGSGKKFKKCCGA
jgi:hypothetical protein